MSDEIADLKRQIEELTEELELVHHENNELRGAILWCGGSSDFGPGGVAYIGWQNICQPLIKFHPIVRIKFTK